MDSVTPRDLHFALAPLQARTARTEGEARDAVLNALSLTFPSGERLFMDAVRNYKPILQGPLLKEAQNFILQEAFHTREHVGLNQTLETGLYPLAEIRAEIDSKVAIIRERGPLAMLSVTISLEHFTAILGHQLLSDPIWGAGLPEGLARLWQWHAMEETEHKAVAYEVFLAATLALPSWSRYFKRVKAMALVTWLFLKDLIRHATMILVAEGMEERRARRAVIAFLFGRPGILRRGWRLYFAWYRPGFHPWDHDNRELLNEWRTKISAGY